MFVSVCMARKGAGVAGSASWVCATGFGNPPESPFCVWKVTDTPPAAVLCSAGDERPYMAGREGSCPKAWPGKERGTLATWVSKFKKAI